MSGAQQGPHLSVALVGICGRAHIDRALKALLRQEGVPPLEIVVAYDPRLEGVQTLRAEYPDVRFVSDAEEQSPLQLVGRAIRETTGEYVLLTEDHCEADPGWAQAMWRGLHEPCGAVGGPIEVREDATPTDWAFYFVDFYRYARPVTPEAPSLTVCNAGYRRADLEALDFDWRSMFVDTMVHDALRERVGPLRLVDEARVTMRRHVRLRDALRERYVFGRVFGSTRLETMGLKDKLVFRSAAGLLPVMIMRRMGTKAMTSTELRSQFVRALGPLSLMAVAWSAGEWLGYWTGTHPTDLSVAQEKRD